AERQINGQREDFKRLGLFGEWDNPYKTMNFSYEANIIRTLSKIIENGHMHKGFKPVHWCTDCGSALAEAEVEYQDRTSPAVDVAFDFVDCNALASAMSTDGAKLDNIDDASLVIWTTTPWTLPANEAVSVHAELDYVLVAVEFTEGPTRNLLLARDLLDSALQRYGVTSHTVLAECKGQDLEKLLLQHPFYQRQVPIILGEHVTTESGTGCVHTAPAHGQEDFVVGKQYGLPVNNPVGANGVFIEDTEIFAGQFVFKANDNIVATLEQNNQLLCHEPYQHSYPHCWRHKKPIIFRATPQWFISMTKAGLRDMAMDVIPGVQWVPDWGQARIESMINNRPDWCISRQRTWGVPMSLFVHKETSELHPDTFELMQKVAEKVEQSGIQAWFDLEAEELLGADAEDYIKVTDTLDVWFDSGVSHASVCDVREQLYSPADLYLEGSDQHRGWFQSSLLTSLAAKAQAPYKAVLTHGFTVDGNGEKMSKSRGNVVAPQTVTSTLGADILRLWVAGTDYQGEIAVSDEILKRTADLYRRIRNTARFLLSNLNGFDVDKDLLSQSELLPFDQFAIDRALSLQNELQADYDNYQFLLVVQKIHNFCAGDLGSFYLDVVKDRQYTAKGGSLAHRSCQSAMYHILEALVRWISPILVFTADEIWKAMPGDRSETIFIQTWYQGLNTIAEDSPVSIETWDQLSAIRIAVNKVIEEKRGKGELGGSLEAEVTLYLNEALSAKLAVLASELRFILITSKAVIKSFDQKPAEAIATDIEGLALTVGRSEHEKCARCWHRVEDVGSDPKHPEICGRCVSNVDGDGETRLFA
ncbi:MAG: isoleucine--tRNA ligase, partial [Gammaproteobacteria bacterium]